MPPSILHLQRYQQLLKTVSQASYRQGFITDAVLHYILQSTSFSSNFQKKSQTSMQCQFIKLYHKKKSEVTPFYLTSRMI